MQLSRCALQKSSFEGLLERVNVPTGHGRGDLVAARGCRNTASLDGRGEHGKAGHSIHTPSPFDTSGIECINQPRNYQRGSSALRSLIEPRPARRIGRSFADGVQMTLSIEAAGSASGSSNWECISAAIGANNNSDRFRQYSGPSNFSDLAQLFCAAVRPHFALSGHPLRVRILNGPEFLPVSPVVGLYADI